jgi:hypothetical protein
VTTPPRGHRITPPELAPPAGWAMGNAGIIRELLRYACLAGGRDEGYAVAWPDHAPVHSRSIHGNSLGENDFGSV